MTEPTEGVTGITQQQFQQQLQQQQQLIELMQQQMTTVTNLQAENNRLRTAADATPAAPIPQAPIVNNTGHSFKSKKPDRPIISQGMDDREWAFFKDTWNRYKTMIGITDAAAIRLELREACSEEVNKLLFEFVGSTTLDACSEDQLLAHIKSVAVKTIHKEVHRLAFNTMIQNKGESITNYVARLNAKSFLCQFEVSFTDNNVTRNISYAEEMVTQRLIAGLANQEHQRKILAEADTNATLNSSNNY